MAKYQVRIVFKDFPLYGVRVELKAYSLKDAITQGEELAAGLGFARNQYTVEYEGFAVPSNGVYKIKFINRARATFMGE